MNRKYCQDCINLTIRRFCENYKTALRKQGGRTLACAACRDDANGRPQVTNYHHCDRCGYSEDSTTYHDVQLANGEKVTLCNMCLHDEADVKVDNKSEHPIYPTAKEQTSSMFRADVSPVKPPSGDNLRRFDSGAVRDTEQGKIDPEGALHPLVIEAYCEYMLKHSTLSDGSSRASDNWQGVNGRGFPRDVLMKSAWRHFLDLWLEHRGHQSREGIEDALAGLMFNVQAYWLEVIRDKNTNTSEQV